MPNKEDSTSRHRMVVEEIELPSDKPAEEVSNLEEKPLVEVVEAKTPDEKPKDDITFGENFNKPPEVNKVKTPIFWILIPGIFILGAILGGIIFYQKGINTTDVKSTPTPIPTSSPIVSSTPTPASEADVDISEFKVSVFNGSGTAGEAGKVKTLLVDAGFTVVSTGNAATYDYTKTIIKAKSSVDDSVIQKIKKALSEDYVVGDNQTLSSSSTTDIQVVVGSSKAE